MAYKIILRRSPRDLKSSPPPPSPSETRTSRASSYKTFEQTMSDGKCFRRSPRLSSCAAKTVNRGEKEASSDLQPLKKLRISKDTRRKSDIVSFLIGEPVPDDEARRRWPWRYEQKDLVNNGRRLISNVDGEDKLVLNVKCHYSQAEIEKCIFNLGDCAYVKGEEGGPNFVGRILEFFKTLDGEDYFRVQWFFRAEDTVMKEEASFHDKKRLFYSTLKNDNLLDCIVSKVTVIQIAPNIASKSNSIPPCDFYYDMEYSVDYSTFCIMGTDNSAESSDLSSSNCIETAHADKTKPYSKVNPGCELYKSEITLLDLYSGCGGMSTGLCLGAKLARINLVTRWAVEINKSACETLKLNHPETQIRNESAEDFLDLLKEWEKLCKLYAMNSVEKGPNSNLMVSKKVESNRSSQRQCLIPPGEYEVASLIDICYGDPSETGKRGLNFKVRWVGCGPSEDTWESFEGLSKCQDHIRDFVRKWFKSRLLPLPGDVDVICGGPPCQGISGYNRYRNVDAPLDDERNRQVVVLMDIVNFLKPKYILMENVVDILRFANGSLGRYALSRLVHMNYQARLGIMAAGSYGLPQFRMRVFFWGALTTEKLPQFPLPTHDVVLRYGAPSEFERNTVAYDEGQPCQLEEVVVLRDALSDLPAVTNNENRDEMPYRNTPRTKFQKYIRTTKDEMMGSTSSGGRETKTSVLYDHRPIPLSEDDYLRVCQIPRRKGANFRDLPGVVVRNDNVVQRDTTKEPQLLPSGKPLIPEYTMTFWQGKSIRPFARLWWDETVPTILCRPDPRNQATLHPEQDRILTIRECARLQGFPDYYRFCGTVKERHTQVGNAVAIPVTKALGYALGMALLKLSGDQPLMTLPSQFASSTNLQLMQSSSSEDDMRNPTRMLGPSSNSTPDLQELNRMREQLQHITEQLEEERRLRDRQHEEHGREMVELRRLLLSLSGQDGQSSAPDNSLDLS